MLVAVLAVLKAGGAYVPLDPSLLAGWRNMVADSIVTVLTRPGRRRSVCWNGMWLGLFDRGPRNFEAEASPLRESPRRYGNLLTLSIHLRVNRPTQGRRDRTPRWSTCFCGTEPYWVHRSQCSSPR